MEDQNQIPEGHSNGNTNIQNSIEELFLELQKYKSELMVRIASGHDDPTIISVFTINFYPRWAAFYSITQLGFDKAILEKEPLKTLNPKAKTQINDFLKTQSKTAVISMLDTFDTYCICVKDKELIKIKK